MTKLFLFDVDGTLAESSKKINESNALTLNELKKRYDIGVLGEREEIENARTNPESIHTSNSLRKIIPFTLRKVGKGISNLLFG